MDYKQYAEMQERLFKSYLEPINKSLSKIEKTLDNLLQNNQVLNERLNELESAKQRYASDYRETKQRLQEIEKALQNAQIITKDFEEVKKEVSLLSKETKILRWIAQNPKQAIFLAFSIALGWLILNQPNFLENIIEIIKK